MLLEQGADIDKAMDDGATPLIMASQEGHVEVVSMLLEQGADIDKASG
jgi:ankyrin repeat protein